MKRILLFFPFILLSLTCKEEVVETVEPVEPKPQQLVREPVNTSLEDDKEENTVQSRLFVAPDPLETLPFELVETELLSKPDSTEAHQEHLNEELSFFALEDYSAWETSFVVGSRVARFYPNAELSLSEDLENLPEGIPIPIGTVLPRGETIRCEDGPHGYSYFKFEDNYNYFFQTKWQDQDGLIFGADIWQGQPEKLNQWGNYRTEDHSVNSVASSIYQQEGLFEEFPPFVGFFPLPDAYRNRLEQDRLIIQQVNFQEYELNIDKPDDMISLYMDDAKRRHVPMFITTDLVSHGLHLFFNKFLQYTEEVYFFPRLEDLVDSYLILLEDPVVEAADPYDRAYNDLITYFQVAQCLLELAPEVRLERKQNSSRAEKIYVERDMETILARYPELVQQEVQLILAAEEHVVSPNFAYKEDYTQYKPRGHYTQNGITESYFRTMMWFGRIHMYISTGEEDIISMDPDDYQQGTAQELSQRHLPMVVILQDLTRNNPEILDQWSALFDPITDLIGASDDLSFYEVIPFFEEEELENLREWINDLTNIVRTIERAEYELEPPLISGNSVFEAPSGDGRTPPMGFRLFGQRFTWDSYVHQNVSPPRLMSRYIVRGLDIMKAFGSNTADQLLEISDYPEMDGLEDQLDEIQEEFQEMDSSFWGSNYYNSTLYMIKTQAQFEEGSGFYFTESPLWGIKAQLSAHGTWAALRHDTILYVKQVYAERAGGDDLQPTYRTEPLPEPVHYIEPNREFFQGALAAVQGIARTMENYELLDENYVEILTAWTTMLERMNRIVELEFEDSPVPQEEVRWIRTIPSQMAPLVLAPGVSYASFLEDNEPLKGAIVADVFTNAESNEVLEVGVGIPYRLYVPLCDSQGRKRIAQGYGFSYYEFLQPQNERMTDEEWKAMVYDEEPSLEDMQPFWSQGLIMEPKE